MSEIYKERFSKEPPERDVDGYLTEMSNCTPEVARAMAEGNGVQLDDVKWQQILKAREYYDEHSMVPPIRKFARYLGEDKKGIFKLWMAGPMMSGEQKL